MRQVRLPNEPSADASPGPAHRLHWLRRERHGLPRQRPRVWLCSTLWKLRVISGKLLNHPWPQFPQLGNEATWWR